MKNTIIQKIVNKLYKATKFYHWEIEKEFNELASLRQNRISKENTVDDLNFIDKLTNYQNLTQEKTLKRTQWTNKLLIRYTSKFFQYTHRENIKWK